MTQNEWVLKYMKAFDSITPKVAYEGFGIMRLASRICELRQQGYKIRSEKVYNKRTGRSHAVYTLEDKDV